MGRFLQQALAIRAAMEKIGKTLSDEQALDAAALFKPWSAGDEFAVGDVRRHGDGLYRCVQGHGALENWTPDATPALWARISVEEWPAWVQPGGAQDAYAKGDRVTHAGARWTSDIAGNVWQPGVYGWTKA